MYSDVPWDSPLPFPLPPPPLPLPPHTHSTPLPNSTANEEIQPHQNTECGEGKRWGWGAGTVRDNLGGGGEERGVEAAVWGGVNKLLEKRRTSNKME